MTFGHYIHQGEAGKISQRKVIQPEASQMRGKPESTVPKPGERRAKVRFATPLHLFLFTRNHSQKVKTARLSQVRDYTKLILRGP